MASEDKQQELIKYRALATAAIDYTIDAFWSQQAPFDLAPFIDNLNGLKNTVEEDYQKGRLGKLKQAFRSFSEGPLESRLLGFNTYIKEKTGYDIDIFESFNNRITTIITRNKINTENEYRDVLSAVDFLCQSEHPDKGKIDILNNLLAEFDEKLDKKQSKSN